MHHYRAKRIIKAKYRETKVVNYSKDNDDFNILSTCTFLDCDEYRMDYDGQIDTNRHKCALGIQYKHFKQFKDYITILVGTLQRIHRQYIRYESALDDTLIGIENLNSGYLTHCILDPKILTKYLEAVEDDLEETAPEFELVFTSVYQYYGKSLI